MVRFRRSGVRGFLVALLVAHAVVLLVEHAVVLLVAHAVGRTANAYINGRA